MRWRRAVRSGPATSGNVTSLDRESLHVRRANQRRRCSKAEVRCQFGDVGERVDESRIGRGEAGPGKKPCPADIAAVLSVVENQFGGHPHGPFDGGLFSEDVVGNFRGQ